MKKMFFLEYLTLDLTKGKKIIILKGVNVRLEADAEEDDLDIME